MDIGDEHDLRLPLAEHGPDRVGIEATGTGDASIEDNGRNPIQQFYGIYAEPGDIKTVRYETGFIYNHEASPAILTANP
jgi:hypothetical protein